MRRWIVIAAAAAWCTGLAVTEDDKMRATLQEVYLAEISVDRPPRPLRLTATNMTYATAYARLLQSEGWTARACMDATCEMITNMCGAAGTFDDFRSRSVYEGAVNAMGRHGDAAVIPYIDYAFGHSVADDVCAEAIALVRLSGLGHDAFALYGGKIGGRRAEDLALAVAHATARTPVCPSVTNRAVRFFLDLADCGQWETVRADAALCRLFPGYSTSSNRYVHVETRLPTATSQNMSNYLYQVESELLALPPGTMQMLSTNRFCNVED